MLYTSFMNRVDKNFSSKTYNPFLTEFKGHKKLDTYFDLNGLFRFVLVDKNGIASGLNWDKRKNYLIYYDWDNYIRRGKW